jgi:hypothetical protein
MSALIARSYDRAGLRGLMDQALDAFVQRDPGRLPLAADVRYTEQGQALALGDGFWATASGQGGYRHAFIDPEAGEVAAMATMLENGNQVLFGLRLRVQLGKVTEIESVFYRRGGGPSWNDAGIDTLNAAGAPEALWLQDIPREKRLPRQALIAVANAYFAGLQNNDGKADYPFTDDCHRIENGVATSNNPGLQMGTPDFNPAAMTVKAQFQTGFYAVVTRIDDRRFPVVDAEKGVVLAYATFNHAGTVHEVVTPEGRVIPMGFFNRPGSILIMEAFKIENGLIRHVEAIGTSVPYGLKTGWPGGVLGA